jgi:hypothetical protein
MTGRQMAEIIAHAYATPAAIVKRTVQAMGRAN